MPDQAPPFDPSHRLRRMRRSPGLRNLLRETEVRVEGLIYPLFVRSGQGVNEPIGAMPGQSRLSVDLLADQAKEIRAAGLQSVPLFGIADEKDALGGGSADPDGIVQRAIREIKSAAPELVVMTDVCLCAYMEHGHCGILRDGAVDNDATLPLLAAMAVSHAQAGADVVAPSAMMDGQIAALRQGLDQAGLTDTGIMAYAAKYASAFYGPFREAAGSAPQFGDRRSYQMDPGNLREAVREILSDVEQGADIVMVKPALAYMDVIRAAREVTDLPVAAYNVSGEYSMVKAAAAQGWIDERALVLETLTSFRRAGADLIITYHAKEAARWLTGS